MRLPNILILTFTTCFVVLPVVGEAPARDSTVHYATDEIETNSSNGSSGQQTIKRAEVRKPASPVKLEKFKRKSGESPSQQDNQTRTPVAEGKLRDLKEAKIAEPLPQTVKDSKQSAID